LVVRHLQQLYDDLNGNAFRQTLDSGNQLHCPPTGNQLSLAQPGNQFPLANPENQMLFDQFKDELPVDESSRRPLAPNSCATDYHTAGTQTYSHIHQWLQESVLPRSSQQSPPQQSHTPHVTVIRPSAPSNDRLDSLQEKRGRALSLPQVNAQEKNLPQGDAQEKGLFQGNAKRKTFNGLSNKRLPELPTGSRTNITVQDVTEISHSRMPSGNFPDQLRIQEAGPSDPLKNILKQPHRNSTIASEATAAEWNHLGFEKDLGLLRDMIVIQVRFCRELLVTVRRSLVIEL
jgi:hypothetical protein